MPLKINPIEIDGPWESGYALDKHTLLVENTGQKKTADNDLEFTRSEIGELLYQFKYKDNFAVVNELAGAAVDFIEEKDWPVDLVVPVPPSLQRTGNSPTATLASHIGQKLLIETSETCVLKTKETSPLKDIETRKERDAALRGAFKSSAYEASEMNILVVDDIFGTGATMTAVVNSLYSQGQAEEVYALAFTKTRGS